MSEETRDSIHRLICDAYRPFADEAESSPRRSRRWRAPLRAPARRPYLCAGRPTCGAAPGPPAVARRSRRRSGRERGTHGSSQSSIRMPLGSLEVLSPERSVAGRAAEACRLIAKTIAYHVKRREVARRAREALRTGARMDRHQRLVAARRSLHRACLPGLAAVADPRRAGSEADSVALALHLANPGCAGSFVSVHCALFQPSRFERQWISRVERAAGGTLLLHRVEALARPLQLRLGEILEHGLASWMQARTAAGTETRLLAQASPRLEERVDSGRFSGRCATSSPSCASRSRRSRAAARISAPSSSTTWRPLPRGCSAARGRGRRGLRRLSLAGTSPSSRGSPAVWRRRRRTAACASSTWRAARPTCCAPRRRRVPWRAGRVPPARPAIRRSSGRSTASPRADHAKLSLADVAAGAYVSCSTSSISPSRARTTFVRFLARLRVEHARRLLRERPREAVTSIAADVGFNELRHFERTFKSLTGCTPKAFRQRATGAGAQQNPPQSA